MKDEVARLSEYLWTWVLGVVKSDCTILHDSALSDAFKMFFTDTFRTLGGLLLVRGRA